MVDYLLNTVDFQVVLWCLMSELLKLMSKPVMQIISYAVKLGK